MNTKDESTTVTHGSQHKFMKLRVRRMRNIIVNTLGILVILFGITKLVRHFWRYTEYEITNNAIIDQYITPVNIRVQGYIESIYFTEHQKVRVGDTLLTLDDTEYRIKVMDAEAALEDAIAAADVLKATVRTSQSNIDVAETAIREAKIRLWKVGEDEKRYADLLKEKSVSLQQYEQVKSDYDAARAKYDLLKQQKHSTQLQTEEIIKKKNSTSAVITRRRADLEMAKLNLSYTVVVAPYDGNVGRRTLGKGQLVQAGQILTNIIRDNEKWVTANYKETQIAHLFVGQEVNIKVDAYKNKVFKGVVSAISEATGSKYSLIPTDNSAGNFVKVQQRIPVRIELVELSEADNKLLRAGMMVETEARVK